MEREAAMLVTIGGTPFRCQICQSEEFLDKEVKLHLYGSPTMGNGLVCAQCGYVHVFMNRSAIEFWNRITGYPRHPEPQE